VHTRPALVPLLPVASWSKSCEWHTKKKQKKEEGKRAANLVWRRRHHKRPPTVTVTCWCCHSNFSSPQVLQQWCPPCARNCCAATKGICPRLSVRAANGAIPKQS